MLQATGRIQFPLIASVPELERDLIHDRMRASLAKVNSTAAPTRAGGWTGRRDRASFRHDCSAELSPIHQPLANEVRELGHASFPKQAIGSLFDQSANVLVPSTFTVRNAERRIGPQVLHANDRNLNSIHQTAQLDSNLSRKPLEHRNTKLHLPWVHHQRIKAQWLNDLVSSAHSSEHLPGLNAQIIKCLQLPGGKVPVRPTMHIPAPKRRQRGRISRDTRHQVTLSYGWSAPARRRW